MKWGYDDPWALLRQVFENTTEEITFDRDQPLSSDLSEREDLLCVQNTLWMMLHQNYQI